MSIEHDYGSYSEWLAGEGVGIGELRDYDAFEEPEPASDNEGNETDTYENKT